MFNGTVTGRGLADLMVGAVGSLEHGVAKPAGHGHELRGPVRAGRVAHERTGSRFNYGVRWEPFLGQQMLYGGATNFSHDNFVNNVKSTVFLNAPAGLTYPGDAGFPGRQERLQEAHARLLAARRDCVGREGRRRLAFRSSYGLTYDFPSGDFMNINASAPPWGNRSLITTTNFDDPYSVVGGNPHPIATNANTSLPGLRRLRRDGSEHPGAARAVVERDA
jgi:hypothetical protein